MSLRSMLCLQCLKPWTRTHEASKDCPFCGSERVKEFVEDEGTPYDQLTATRDRRVA